MSALHAALMVDGEAVGDLISVGSSVTLFAVRVELAALDGATFRSIAEAHKAAAAMLGGGRIGRVAGGMAGLRRPRQHASTMQRSDDT